MKRWIGIVSMTFVFSVIGIFSSFAGQWMQDTGRTALEDGVSNWWWQEDDGSRARGYSLWLDGNQDGVYESYTFNEEGWMLADTVTEYGGRINADGALMDDAVTVSQLLAPRDTTVVATDEFTLTLPENWKNHFCYQVRGGNLFIEYFPIERMEFAGVAGGHATETLVWIMAYDTKAERDAMGELGLLDNWRELGTHDGVYYVSCTPTDTAMEFYTEEEREQMRQMRESLWEDGAIGVWERMGFH